MTANPELRDYYKFKNAVMAGFVIDDFLTARDRLQWDSALKPIYRIIGSLPDRNERLNWFFNWIDSQWNAETIRGQIVKYPPNIQKYWSVCFVPNRARGSQYFYEAGKV